MVFRRGGFALTPPSLLIFIISLVLAVAALLVRYAGLRIGILSGTRVFDALAIAYILLVAGVIFRRL